MHDIMTFAWINAWLDNYGAELKLRSQGGITYVILKIPRQHLASLVLGGDRVATEDLTVTAEGHHTEGALRAAIEKMREALSG